ncbi:MAG: MFS transporter [Oligoflexia bacterium]|nr:MFS transporter [Oligoflexia bacterium]
MAQLQLLRTRRFAPFFCTQFLGAFNDNLFKNALIILIAFKASSVLGIPSSQMVAVAGGIFILPFFLFSATSGQLADKYEKTTIIRWVKLAEIAIMALATVGFVFHQFGYLLVVLFLMGLHSTFFGPVKYSILPQLLPQEELVTGNALVGAGTFLAILFGTILGGLLVTQEPYGPIAVSVGLLIVATSGWLTSRAIPRCPAMAPELKVEWNPIPPTLSVSRSIRSNRTVFLSVLGISWFWFFGAAFLSLFPPYCKEFLQANESVVTFFLTLFSVGIAIGSSLCERLSNKRLELGMVPFGSIGMSIFAADLFLAGHPWAGAEAATLRTVSELFQAPGGLRIILDLLLVSVFGGFYFVPLYTLIQERADPAKRSRVVAANNILNSLFMVVASLLLMGMMIAKLTYPQMFLVLAGLNAAVALYIYSVIPEFLLRFLAWILAHLMYRVRVTGAANIPATGPALLVCNHVSFIDWLIIYAMVRRPVRFVMDYNYIPSPLGRFLTRHAKVIPIATAKEDTGVLLQAFRGIAAELRDGNVVCLFPEGRITHDGKLAAFRPGVERVIADTPVPVIPMALQGFWGSIFSRQGGKALSRPPRRFWSRVGLAIGTALPPTEANVEALRVRVAELRGEHA